MIPEIIFDLAASIFNFFKFHEVIFEKYQSFIFFLTCKVWNRDNIPSLKHTFFLVVNDYHILRLAVSIQDTEVFSELAIGVHDIVFSRQ